MVLNSWDIQCKHIHTVDGVSSALYSGQTSFTVGEVWILIPSTENKNEAKDTNRETVL